MKGSSSYPRTEIALPAWVEPFVAERGDMFTTHDDRMRLAIALARENVEQGTGGPFGAAVFDSAGRLIAPGVNLVVGLNCSVAHAEIVAIMTAQQALGSFDLGADGMPLCELATSTEPCAMCMGAIPWSGVRRLVCGATGNDAEAIGMDEGAKPADWVTELESRGIEVIQGVRREEATEVLQQYAANGGTIYNGRS